MGNGIAKTFKFLNLSKGKFPPSKLFVDPGKLSKAGQGFGNVRIDRRMQRSSTISSLDLRAPPKLKFTKPPEPMRQPKVRTERQSGPRFQSQEKLKQGAKGPKQQEKTGQTKQQPRTEQSSGGGGRRRTIDPMVASTMGRIGLDPMLIALAFTQIESDDVDGPEEPQEPDPNLGARQELQEALIQDYRKAKAGSPADKKKFIEETLPKYFDEMRAKGAKIDGALVSDALLMASYMELPPGTKFKVKLDGGEPPIATPGTEATFTLKTNYTQRLDPASLASSRNGGTVGTGYQIWDMEVNGETKPVVAFRGTNSVGKSRDSGLGKWDATGATANSVAISDWVDQELSRKGSPLVGLKPALVVGHSQGGLHAQDYLEHLYEKGQKPLGYCASSEAQNRPQKESWQPDLVFYTRSTYDPVPRGGNHWWGGREAVAQELAHISSIAPDKGDKLLNHGVLFGMEAAVMSAPLDFQERAPSGGGIKGMALDLGRQYFADYAFTPTPIERILEQVDRSYLGTLFHEKGSQAPRGKDLACFVHLADQLVESSPAFAQLYREQPTTALGLLSECSQQILNGDTEKGLSSLARGVTTVRERQWDPENGGIPPSPKDLQASVLVAKDTVESLKEQLKKIKFDA